MEANLHLLVHGFEMEIFLFVLMSNHFHMLARAPRNNLSAAMNYFMRETSRDIGRAAGRINQIYGGRFFRTCIPSHHHYLCAYKYNYRNPVDAGLTDRVEHYPYSTLAGILGLRQMAIPMSEDLTLISDVEGTLRWLNDAPDKEKRERVRKALRKPIMKFTTPQKTGRPDELNVELY